MQQKEIIEGNELIARFMGMHLNKYGMWCKMEDLTILNGEEYAENWYRVLIFHTSWDWLMPACKKFYDLVVSPRAKRRRKEYEMLCGDIDNAVTCYDPLLTFESLVKAIQWYNSNHPSK